MKCGIVNCVQNDNRFLWRCQGSCKRTYHAACIGVQRNHEEILRTFMMPVCQDCQEKFTSELDLNVLSSSFKNITESIGHTLAANHKLMANYNSLRATHEETLERIEKMLGEINENISYATTSSRTSAVEIKNKLSALLDTPPVDTSMVEKAVKSSTAAAVDAITTTITTTATAHSIDLLPEMIAELRNDLMDSNANLSSDVKLHMEEMAKTFSVPDARIRNPFANSNLANELQDIIGAPEQPPQQQKHQPRQTTTSDGIADLKKYFADRRAKLSKLCAEDIGNLSPGWRFLGNKRCWKQDWSEYDAKQRTRKSQEKAAEKAKSRRKRQREIFNQNNASANNNIRNCSNYNSISNSNNNNNSTDKNLLAKAKEQFSGPPATIDHPVAGLSILAAKSSFINFKKGETINPYRANERKHPGSTSINIQPQQNQNMLQHASCCQEVNNESLPPIENRGSQFELDPLRPPIVRLTEQSVEGDGRFLKARLRDPKIMKIVRLYLAYMKDQPATVCIEGMTSTSIRMLLASEGLPTAPDHLHRIFAEVHQEYGLNAAEATADLQSYQRFLSSERTHRLQQLRESSNKFHTPRSHFRK